MSFSFFHLEFLSECPKKAGSIWNVRVGVAISTRCLLPLKVDGTSVGDMRTTSGCSKCCGTAEKDELLSESTIKKVGRRVKA